ncbi:efflux RND transporter permease subunit [Prolixibacteraceae bacterium JC049]|nr:efflux RND transporter permease subunit [Prolixibacteraceae bacterium JC049]
MLNKIIHYALHNRFTMIVAALLLLIAGSYTTSRMDIDVFPDLNAPTVVILTEAHGLAPEEVEKLVTFPIETSINGSTGLRRVRSSSAEGFSIVWAEFGWDMDTYNARQIISEKLMTLTDLPKGVDRPVLAPQSSLMGEIMILALTSETTSPMQLRTMADWNVRTRLLSESGVAQITVQGGDFKEYQILIDPMKMRYYDVSMSEVISVCKGINENAPGGFLNEHGNRYIIRGIIRTKDPKEIAESVIKTANGYPIKVSDIAQVKLGAAPKIGLASYKGNNAVVMTITKQPNVNTLELTGNLKKAIAEIQATLPEDVKIHTDIFDQSQFIETSVNNVQKALIEGAILVIVILFVFLMNYRTTVISLLAIPLSLLVAIITLRYMGITINTMTLGGMAIAIGSLVDDAIIDVENVYKRLRENIKLPEKQRKSILTVVYDASVEIRASILNATLIIIVAFAPLFFLDGMEGRMLKPLGIAYIVSLFASLLVAVTLTPVLCSMLLTGEKQLLKHENGSWLERKLRTSYQSSLTRIFNHKRLVLGVTGALVVLAIGLYMSFGRSFLPPFNEGTLTINVSTVPGISLEESDKLGLQAEKALLSIPEITVVERRTGRAELAEHSFGSNSSELDAPFTLKDRPREEFLREVRYKLGAIAGVSVEVGQPISHRMNHMLSGTRSSIAIKLFGQDLGKMYQVANEIKTNISDIPGVADLNVEQQVEIPQIRIKPRRTLLAKYGIPLNEFSEFVDIAFAGEKVSDVFEGQRKYDVVLRYNDQYRNSIEAVRSAMIDTHDGKKIPLHFVADIESITGPNTVSRENVRRKIVISANVAERDLRSVVNDIQAKVNEKVKLPEGYHVEYGGQFESEAAASRMLLIASLLALLIIFMLLYQEFKNVTLTSVIMLNLPLALIGGMIAIWMSSSVISIPAIIGFITLFGIATRNGILLVSRYEHLAEEGMPLRERIIKGSADRLNPILMTALTAALALIPLAMAGDKPGNEIQSPMAIVILGGLLSSTLLNAFVIPLVYERIKKKTEK